MPSLVMLQNLLALGYDVAIMEHQGGAFPLPTAALSLHAFAPTSISAQRPARVIKAPIPSSAIVIRDGPSSHPVDTELPGDAEDSEMSGEHRMQRWPHTLARLVVAIPGTLSRLVSFPPSQVSFTDAARLSDTRVFPSLLPRRAARGGGSVPGGGTARKPTVLWFRNDLRLHDNPSLDRACREGTSVLPVYVFDPRDYEKGPSGCSRSGPSRAQFVLDSVADLRARLRAAGSELLVRLGRPEEVVPELAAVVGAGMVYCQKEVTEDDVQVEGRVRASLERAGCELRSLWGGTLYHLDDLPFKLSTMPNSYADFLSRVSRLSVRPLVASERGIKGLPQATGLEAGELPSLEQLGVTTSPPPSLRSRMVAAGDGGGFGAPALTAAPAVPRGGETEALQHLQAFLVELKATISKSQQQQQWQQRWQGHNGKAGSPSSSATSAFSCRISPWLALGCLSPRRMYMEMKEQLGRMLRPQQQNQQQPRAGGRGGMSPGGGTTASSNNPANWLFFELLWRDYFRFLAQGYTSISTSSCASRPMAMTTTPSAALATRTTRLVRSPAAHAAAAAAAAAPPIYAVPVIAG